MKFNHDYFGSLMKAQCINQADLAGVLSVSQATISEWKRGKSSPRGHRIFDLANELDVDPGALFCTNGSNEIASDIKSKIISRSQKAEVISQLNQIICSLAEGHSAASIIARIAGLIQNMEGDI